MLNDQRAAPLFGSKEPMVANQYHYRLCDYALFLLEKMQGNAHIKLPVEPAGRDSLIRKLIGQ